MFNLNRSTEFRTSLVQFGQSAADLVWTTSKLPFSGGWGRVVLLAPPIFLLYGGIVYIVSKLAIRILSSVGHHLYVVTKSLYDRVKDYFSPNNPLPVPPLKPPYQPPVSHVPTPPVVPPKLTPPIIPPPQVVYKPKPLPTDAAKDRNQSLLKFSAIVEEFVIDPLLKKKDLIAGINCSEKELKTWLMSMSLWSLGKTWDELEMQYVKFTASPIDTLDLIQQQAALIDSDIGKVFEKNKQLADYEAILKAINGSTLSDKNKLALVALYYKYEAIIKGTKNPKSAAAEEDEIRQKFAQAMNYGMATTLTHMIDIAQGWLTLVDKPSVTLIPVFPSPVQAPNAAAPDRHTLLVEDVSTQLKENLTNKYLVPLWVKKYREWKRAVEDELKKIQLSDPNLFDDYMKGAIDDKKLLESSDSSKISTSLVSSLFFMRAVGVIGDDSKTLQPPIHRFLTSLFNQASPTVAETLRKLSDAITQISFERTIPKIADYFIELLNYCVEMQTQINSSNQGNSSYELSSFFAELEKIGIKGFDKYKLIKIEPQMSGIDFIKQFDADKIHKVVHRTFDSPKYEEGWIRNKKDQLKTVLRIHAEKYANQQDSWIARLFKTNLAVKSPNLLTQLLALPTKLAQFPALDGFLTVIFSGIESFVENKGIISTQEAINEITTTSYLSRMMIISVVKQLIVKNKWKDNLPLLQEAYLYLQPDEKEQVLKHLAAIFDANEYQIKKQEIENSTSVLKKDKDIIEKLHKEEHDLAELLNQLSNTLKVPNLDKTRYDLIIKTMGEIKRKKELEQFNRTVILICRILIDDYFKTGFTQWFAPKLIVGLKNLIRKILTLLTYQEFVKHLIFSIIDLLIEELEQTTHNTQSQVVSQQKGVQNLEKSLLDFINPQQKDLILDSLCELMNAVGNDAEWYSNLGIQIANNTIAKTYLSDQIEGLRENLKYTPAQLNEKIMNSIADYGKKPEGLSSSIIEGLTEHVADPR